MLWLALALGQTVDTGYDPANDPYGGCDQSCFVDGQCTPKQGECMAEGDDCLDSQACEEGARCTAKDGVCVHAEGDCRKTWGCERDGTCVDQGDSCVAGAAADCAASDECARIGRCDLVGAECVASSAQHCAASSLCDEMGWCGLSDDGCTPTEDAHCAASADCRRDGDCVLREGMCAPTPESCAASTGCREDGECTHKGFGCIVASEADCTRSEACTVEGKCAFDGNRCVAKTDAACKASSNCREQGDCWFIASTYEKPEPAPATDCPEGDEKCVAMEIARTAGVIGVLSMGGGGGHGDLCGPKSDADCAQGTKCADEGWCTMREGEGGGFSLGPAGPTCTPEGHGSVFGALSATGDLDSMFGSGLGSGVEDPLGGLLGGTEMGAGGLGSYGSGSGGGGSAMGIGGLGTKGTGGGAVGYGSIDVGTASEPEPRFDPVRVKGDRKPSAVRVGLRAVRANVKKCTEAEVSVGFEVSAKGKISAVEVRSGAEGKAADCVKKAVSKASLDKGPAVSVTWTVRAGSAKKD